MAWENPEIPKPPLLVPHPKHPSTASPQVPSSREQLHSISWPWGHRFSSCRIPRTLGIMVMLKFFPPPFTTPSCPCHKEVEDQLPRDTAEFGKLPGWRSSVEREKREGEEVKWWENLEAGQGVTLK